MFIYERNGKTVVTWDESIPKSLAEIKRIAEEYFPSVPPERIRIEEKICNDERGAYRRIVLSEV